MSGAWNTQGTGEIWFIALSLLIIWLRLSAVTAHTGNPRGCIATGHGNSATVHPPKPGVMTGCGDDWQTSALSASLFHPSQSFERLTVVCWRYTSCACMHKCVRSKCTEGKKQQTQIHLIFFVNTQKILLLLLFIYSTFLFKGPFNAFFSLQIAYL